MRNKRLMFLRKISNFDNFVDSDESVRFARLIIEEIDKAYNPPEGSELDEGTLKESTEAAEEILSLNEEELKQLQESLDSIKGMEKSYMAEKEASDYMEMFIKLSYFNNLKKLNDAETANYLYKNTVEKISFEDINLDENKKFKKISIDLSNLDDYVASESIEAFELTKQAFLGNSLKHLKFIFKKTLPFIGFPIVIYGGVKHIKQSFEIWEKELSEYSEIGSIADLCSVEYMLNFYYSNKLDLHMVLRIVKAIKSSSSFIFNFLMSIISFVDLAEMIITTPMKFTFVGAILEIILSMVIYYGGEAISESQAEDMLDILKIIRADMEKIVNSKP